MAFDLRRRRGPRTLIGLTPLIDVVFILLVFFMLASRFNDWRAIGLDVPAGAGGRGESTAVEIRLSADGAVLLGGEPTAWAGLPDRLARLAGARDPQPRVVVRADAGVPFQRAVDAMHAAGAAGFDAVTLGRGAR